MAITYFTFHAKNTFCISLLSNKPRTEKMQKRFETIGLDAGIWPASTKENLTNQFADYLNDNSRGCAQSHYNIWSHIVDNNLEYGLILEDDACFDKQFFAKINAFFTDVNDNEWDALFLNASESMPIQNKWCLVKDQYLTGGYIVSKKGCERLIRMYSSCLYTADWMTSRLQFHNHCYSYFPWIIIQEGNETTVNSNVVEDHKKVVRLLNEIGYSMDNYLM